MTNLRRFSVDNSPFSKERTICGRQKASFPFLNRSGRPGFVDLGEAHQLCLDLCALTCESASDSTGMLIATPKIDFRHARRQRVFPHKYKTANFSAPRYSRATAWMVRYVCRIFHEASCSAPSLLLERFAKGVFIVVGQADHGQCALWF